MTACRETPKIRRTRKTTVTARINGTLLNPAVKRLTRKPPRKSKSWNNGLHWNVPQGNTIIAHSSWKTFPLKIKRRTGLFCEGVTNPPTPEQAQKRRHLAAEACKPRKSGLFRRFQIGPRCMGNAPPSSHSTNRRPPASATKHRQTLLSPNPRCLYPAQSQHRSTMVPFDPDHTDDAS